MHQLCTHFMQLLELPRAVKVKSGEVGRGVDGKGRRELGVQQSTQCRGVYRVEFATALQILDSKSNANILKIRRKMLLIIIVNILLFKQYKHFEYIDF